MARPTSPLSLRTSLMPIAPSISSIWSLHAPTMLVTRPWTHSGAALSIDAGHDDGVHDGQYLQLRATMRAVSSVTASAPHTIVLGTCSAAAMAPPAMIGPF